MYNLAMQLDTIENILQVVFLIMSVVIHEVSHGYAALMLGDKTAFYAKRLTLNPIRHIDLFGSIILPLLLIISKVGFIVGWAKPVPYNPYNLSNQRWGGALVALAGPASNFLLAIIFAIFLRLNTAGLLNLPEIAIGLFSMIVLINLVLGFFNFLPIPPLDGSKIFTPLLPERYASFFENFGNYGFFASLLFILLLWKPFSYFIMLVFGLLVS